MNNQPPALAKGRKCWYRSNLERGGTPEPEIMGKIPMQARKQQMKKQSTTSHQSYFPSAQNVADIPLLNVFALLTINYQL